MVCELILHKAVIKKQNESAGKWQSFSIKLHFPDSPTFFWAIKNPSSDHMAQKIMSHRKKDQKDSKKEGNACSHMSYLQQRLDKRKRRYFVPSTSERTIKRSVFISTASRAAKLSLSLTLITWNAGEKSWVNYTVQKEVHRSTQPGSAGPSVCKTPFSGNPPFQTCTFLSIDIHKPCSQQHLQSRSHLTRWRKPSDSRKAWAPLVRTPLAPNFHLVRVRLAVLVHAATLALVSLACSTLWSILPTFTPWRSLLGSAGGTTASFVLTMGTMFIRRSSWSVPLRFRRFCSSWKSKLVTKI